MRRTPALAIACGLAAGALASSAVGADIWWAESSSSSAGWPSGRVAYAPVAGGGSVTTYDSISGRPSRVAVVGAATAWNTIAASPYTISAWSVTKSGSATTAASSTDQVDFGPLAIASATGKIYFGTRGSGGTSGLVQVANLDGSGSPVTLYDRGAGITVGSTQVDAANNRLYWCEFPPGTSSGSETGSVLRGSLDGSGPATVLFSNEFGCNGLAVNTANAKIYWARYQTFAGDTSPNSPSLIRAGNLDGSGSASTLYSEGQQSSSGLALDSTTGKLYWANQSTMSFVPGTGAVRVGHVSGSPAAADLYTGLNNPNGVSLAAPGSAPAPAPAPAPITKLATMQGKVQIGPAKGVRGLARKASLRLKYDQSGRYAFLVQRPNGKRMPMLRGSKIGTRTLTKSASAAVVQQGVANRSVDLALILGGRSVPKGTVLRVVYSLPTGGIVKQNIALR